jgi:hypothetical protein
MAMTDTNSNRNGGIDPVILLVIVEAIPVPVGGFSTISADRAQYFNLPACLPGLTDFRISVPG